MPNVLLLVLGGFQLRKHTIMKIKMQFTPDWPVRCLFNFISTSLFFLLFVSGLPLSKATSTNPGANAQETVVKFYKRTARKILQLGPLTALGVPARLLVL